MSAHAAASLTRWHAVVESRDPAGLSALIAVVIDPMGAELIRMLEAG